MSGPTVQDAMSLFIMERFKSSMTSFLQEKKDEILPEEMMRDFIEKSIKDLFDAKREVTVTYTERNGYNSGSKATIQMNPNTAIVMEAVLPIFRKELIKYLAETEDKLKEKVFTWLSGEAQGASERLMEIDFDRLAKGSFNILIGNLFLAQVANSKATITAGITNPALFSNMSTNDVNSLHSLSAIDSSDPKYLFTSMIKALANPK